MFYTGAPIGQTDQELKVSKIFLQNFISIISISVLSNKLRCITLLNFPPPWTFWILLPLMNTFYFPVPHVSTATCCGWPFSTLYRPGPQQEVSRRPENGISFVEPVYASLFPLACLLLVPSFLNNYQVNVRRAKSVAYYLTQGKSKYLFSQFYCRKVVFNNNSNLI